MSSPDLERELQEEALPHMDAVYRYARRLAGNDKDAEDLLQETFLRAFRFWHNYQKGTNCKAWLFRILRNLSINRAQSQARQPVSASLEDTEDYFLYGRMQDPEQSLVDNPERTFFTHHWSPEILAALDKLPEEYRSAVVLCDVEGLSYQEIAEILEVPIGTVRSRLNRARGKLQQLLYQYVKENQPDLLKNRDPEP